MRLAASLVFVATLALLAACGGSSGGGDGPAAPTLTAIAPMQGSTAGGTAVTLTGTHFTTGTTVTFGGTPATAVVVVNETTVTCLTPAGAGTVDCAITVSGNTATLAASFTYFAPPTVTGVDLPGSSNFGGTTITVMGTGFVANAAGANTVTIGGVPATGVTTIDDTSLTCVTPALGAGATTLVVSNANGEGSTAYSLFEPILIADAGGSPVPAAWNLWAFDPITGFAHVVGPIGFGVTSMDFHSTTGVLYGTTAPGAAGGPRELITIDPVTGAGTLIGPTDDGGATNHRIQGCAFTAGVLRGFDVPSGTFFSINLTNGFVSAISTPGFLAAGGGYAVNAADALGYYLSSDVGTLQGINPATGAFTTTVALSGYSQTGGRLKSATFHAGTLYAVSAVTPGQAGTNRQVVSIDTATGVITAVGPALPSMLAGGMASRTR